MEDQHSSDDQVSGDADGERTREQAAFLEESRASLAGSRLPDESEALTSEDYEAMFDLGCRILESGDLMLAAYAFDEYITSAADQVLSAARCLEVGVEFEKVEAWMVAARFYNLGIQLEPMEAEVLYFLNNNFGYVSNQLGHHERAERHCRIAIQVDPLRHNAWKNLGIALEGRGLHGAAAKAYITAVRACPGDPRALGHLEAMVEGHRKSVEVRIPDIDTIIARFRTVVGAFTG